MKSCRRLKGTNVYKSKYQTVVSVLSVIIFASGLLLSSIVIADELKPKDQEWKLLEEQWDLIKQGEQLLKMTMMKQVIDVWSLRQGQAIELRYPGGEEGEIWVEELKDWLISLAIPSKYLFTVAGSGDADVIIIKIFKFGDVSR